MKEILEQILHVGPIIPATSGYIQHQELDVKKLATFLAKQQEENKQMFENITELLAQHAKQLAGGITENPDGSITYKGDTYHRKITPQEVHKAWKEAKTITEAMGLDKP